MHEHTIPLRGGELLAELVDAAEVARILGLRTVSGVRSLVARGELAVAGRGAHNRAFFRRSDLLAMMERRAARYSRQRSQKKGANDGERKMAGRATDLPAKAWCS